jgi:hypothetical protein
MQDETASNVVGSRRRQAWWMPVVAFLTAIAVAGCEQQQPGPAQRAGAAIDQTTTNVEQNLGQASQATGQALDRAGQAVGAAANRTGQYLSNSLAPEPQPPSGQTSP